jgi:hypothetical protein
MVAALARPPANPLYPNVPSLPGVPPVFRGEGNPGTTFPQNPLTHDAPGVAAGARAAWGIYRSGGGLALTIDSVKALEPGREFRVSDYPVEKGAFQSYDKVATPAETRITVTKGGSDTDRQGFLDQLDKLIESTDLFNIVTPDTTFLERNLIRYDYRRSNESGATLLTVEIQTVEIRQSVQTTFSDSKQPSGAKTTNAGPVQPRPATIAQTPPAAPPSTNPAIQDIPAIDSSTPALDRARTVTALIQAGGSINDLVTKGVSFVAIPTLSVAAQSLTTALNGQSVRLEIAQKAFGLSTDVYVNDALIIGGVMIENDNPIVRSAYLGFLGDLYFHDTQPSGGPGIPSYTDLGGRYALLYAGA